MRIAYDIHEAVESTAKRLWPGVGLPKIEVSVPPNSKFGDYSCAIALGIAKELRAKPLEIANQLKDGLGKIGTVKEVTVTEPGFLNFILDYQAIIGRLDIDIQDLGNLRAKPKNVVIEHTSVNPNKAAHIGHLRNACLGDSLARMAKKLGHHIEIQNYIDDLGLQVADSVVAFETFGDAPEGTPADKWFWKIYADIQKKYEGQPELLKRRVEILKEMEEDKNETAKEIVKKIVDAHLGTFSRFDIKYDLLVYEHDIVRNHLWEELFGKLKEKDLITRTESGDNAGAWVVEFGKGDREDKILVRSNGVPTYTAKDIAYQLWKFGESEMPGYKRKFKHADLVVNIIDERQSYPQAVIKYVLSQLGYQKEATDSFHLAYGVVKLSEKAAKQLGKAKEDKTSSSMSGREGVGVMVDDLLNIIIAKQVETHKTPPKIAEQIAVGSIRYYMLKTRPQREILFDFDEALRTDGNTGVYLQYAYARASNILKKAARASTSDAPLNAPAELTDQEKQLIKLLSEFGPNLWTAFNNNRQQPDPSLLCDYAYGLAVTFAKFYETNPVIKAEAGRKNFRIGLVSSYRSTLGEILKLLGIPRLEKI